MDINPLKDKLGDETFAQLQQHITDLIGQRDAARTESITGRKGKDQKIQALTERLRAIEEWAGIDSETDVSALPAPKEQVEVAKQYEAKLKRAERERDDARKTADEAAGKYRSSLQQAAVAKALGGHEFVARDIVETYVGQRLQWEGEELLFKTDDGKLVSVADGVAGIAKARPELLKAAGTGGAGVRQPAAGSGVKTIAEAEFNSKPPSEQAALMKDGYTLT